MQLKKKILLQIKKNKKYIMGKKNNLFIIHKLCLII